MYSRYLIDFLVFVFQVDQTTCDTTDESKSSSNASQLGMNNLGGVFVFLIGGLALALLIALIEFLVNAFVNSKTDKVRMTRECIMKHSACFFGIERAVIVCQTQQY